MMFCPDCKARCKVKQSQRRKTFISRHYYCQCGTTFVADERVVRKWTSDKPRRKQYSGDAAKIYTYIQREALRKAA